MALAWAAMNSGIRQGHEPGQQATGTLILAAAPLSLIVRAPGLERLGNADRNGSRRKPYRFTGSGHGGILVPGSQP